MTDAGRGSKIKNIFVEPYDPLYMSGDCRWIMKEETKPAAGFFIPTIMAIGFAVLSIVVHPVWLIGIVVLVVFCGWPFLEKPIQRKRKYIPRGGEVDGWYNIQTADSNNAYKDQLLDYMDHLRAGGHKITSIEQELRHWVFLEKKYETQKVELEKQQIAEQMSRKEQINEYEKMLKEITQ